MKPDIQKPIACHHHENSLFRARMSLPSRWRKVRIRMNPIPGFILPRRGGSRTARPLSCHPHLLPLSPRRRESTHGSPRRGGSRTARPLSCHPHPLPLSPRRRESTHRSPRSGGFETRPPSPPQCHSERSETESGNLVAFAPSPSVIPAKAGIHPPPSTPQTPILHSLPMKTRCR